MVSILERRPVTRAKSCIHVPLSCSPGEKDLLWCRTARSENFSMMNNQRAASSLQMINLSHNAFLWGLDLCCAALIGSICAEDEEDSMHSP